MPVVCYGKIISAPAEKVWSIVGDFGSLPAWFPFVATTELNPTGGNRQIGTIRTSRGHDDSTIVEKLVGLSDDRMRLSYEMLSGDAPVTNFLATLSVFEISDTATSFVRWTATFDALEAAEPAVDWVRNGIFHDCLTELDRSFDNDRSD